MTDSLKGLATVPIENLLAAANEKLKHATIDELATLLAGGKPTVDSTAQIAEMILAMPAEGSKLDHVQDALVLHALEASGGNVSAAARLMGEERKSMERKIARAKRRAK